MKSILAAMAGAILLLAGCDKPYEVETPLAVTQRDIQLTKDAGSTHVLVYSNGTWKASFVNQVDWASINKTEGSSKDGIGEFVFSYSANYGVTRQVSIALECGSARDTIVMTQAGSISEPSYAPDYSSVSAVKQASKIKVPVTCNVVYGIDVMETSVSYEDSLATPWISDVEVSKSAVTFNVSENTSGEPRTGVIALVLPDYSGNNPYLISTKITVVQGVDSPVFTLKDAEGQYDGSAATYTAESTENNIWAYSSLTDFEIEGNTDDDKWISGVKITTTGLQFSLTANKSGGVRYGTIKATYTTEDGASATASYKITQDMYPEEMPFEEARALTPGKLESINYIEGYIVSDYASLNNCTNTQTAQFMFDFTTSDKTAYLESKDGKYGFCIKFATAADAKIARWSKVQLQLKGLYLTKQSDPERYMISGVTTANFLDIKAGTASSAPQKVKTIDQLTNDDLYTYVSIPDVEIVYKDGCFTNCTDGYSYKCAANPYSGSSTAPRWDTAPTMMTDQSGNTISLLTNSMVTWRRGLTKAYDLNWGSILPQGSGTCKGILVAETLARYNMESVGKYQLRAMAKDEIALDNAAFSKTIVEWNWDNRVADLDPEIGTGTITGYGSTAAAADFNNLFAGASGDGGNGGSTSNQKGLVSNGGIKFTNSWWDFTNDVGKYFDITLSTAGISGSNLVFGIVWGHGSMNNTTLDSPAHWNLLYSIDGGSTFKKVEGNYIKNRSIVWWTTTSQDSTPGFQEYLRKLPNECFGREKLVLRLQAADKVTDISPATTAATWQTNLGIEKGTLTDKATELRIGTITVRYN